MLCFPVRNDDSVSPVVLEPLGKDMNKTLQRRGIQFHVNEKLGLKYCIYLLVFVAAAYVPDICTLISRFLLNGMHADVLFGVSFIARIIAAVVALFCLFALIGFLRNIKNGAIALLTHAENDSPQEPEV